MLVSELLKKPFEPRRYQETIFAQSTMHNTLVVLPTGLGKTMIAVMLAAHRLKEHPDKKILVLAPTKPLVQQHERTFREYLDLPENGFALFTGAVSPEQRAQRWHEARVVFSTPQGLENDVLSSRIRLTDVALIVFDEAHRAVGDYAYVFLAAQAQKQAHSLRVLALTASPGTSEEEITEVCKSLGIEEIEVRAQTDADVAPYVQELDIHWCEVDLPPEFAETRKLLADAHEARVAQLRSMNLLQGKFVGKRVLLELQGRLQGELAKGFRDPESMQAVSVAAQALKIGHAIELLDTQGLSALGKYFQGLREQATAGQSKAVVQVVSDVRVKTAQVKVAALIERQIEHPKLRELRRIILAHAHRQGDVKIIVFTQYRDQATRIIEAVRELNITAHLFVGQQKKGDTGMSQKEQRAMLDRFASGEFRVLVATSVAEEGLDIPKVDLVLFYEPVPSAIRTVQRRGRTGRGERGEVIVLVARGTSDEGYKWSAHHKEKRMYRSLATVKRTFRASAAPGVEARAQQNLLQAYHAQKKEDAATVVSEQLAALKIVGDYREKASPVMKELVNAGVQLELQQLAVGDYHISERVVVEYKQVVDFVDSILDGRLLAQLKSLRQYARPIILVEGEADIYSVRRVHPNAIRGMLATIAVSYNIPILWSRSPRETAGLLIALARREQVGGTEFQYHTQKPLSDDDLMEYIIAAFPGIGSQLAKPLLSEFKTIQGVVNASAEELRKVALIGEKKAKRIKELSEREYGKGT